MTTKTQRPSPPTMREIDQLCDKLRATLKKLARSGSTVGIRYKVGVVDVPSLEGTKHEPNGTMSMIIEINGGARDTRLENHPELGAKIPVSKT